MKDYRLEATIESLEILCEDSPLNIQLTPEQIEEIAKTILEHIDMLDEMEMNRHMSAGPHKPEFIPADNIQLYRRVRMLMGTRETVSEERAGTLGDEVYCKETLYIKRA